MGKQTEHLDARKERTVQEDGETHTQLVNVPMNLGERAQTKQTGAAWEQRRDTERTWENA